MDKKDILLVIDLQKEFKDRDGAGYEKCLDYIRRCHGKYDRMIGTLFTREGYPDGTAIDRQYETCLGWDGCVGCNESSLEYKPDIVIRKKTYALSAEKLSSALPYEEDSFDCDYRIDIIGCDTDACVLATAFSLWDAGTDFRVLAGFCYSSGGESQHLAALEVMRRSFGSRVIEDARREA